MTYSGNPSPSDRDTVRFLIGDTTVPEFLTDEEIDWCLIEEVNIYLAGALCCESIAARLAQEIDKSVGDISVQLSQKYAHYVERGKWLRYRASKKHPGAVYYTNPPEEEHYFSYGQFDNNRTW